LKSFLGSLSCVRLRNRSLNINESNLDLLLSPANSGSEK
jgi:hypothetical protein